MLIKIKREDCLDKFPKFPEREYDHNKDEEKYFSPKIFKSYILKLNSKSSTKFNKLLGIELAKFITDLGVEDLIFLGDNNQYWLTKLSLTRDDSRPLKRALQYLIENKIGKRFNGGLQVDKSELAIFIKHLSWLIRCDASLPYFHFSDKRQNFIGSICQYGNIHFDTLNQKTDKVLKTILSESRFEIVIKC